MKLPWRPRSVRMRLTLWYTGTLAVVLLLHAAGVFWFLKHTLAVRLDRQLHEDFELVEERLETGPDGRVRYHPSEHHEEEGVGAWVQVWDGAGRLLHESPALEREGIGCGDLPWPPAASGYRSVAVGPDFHLRVLCDNYAAGAAEVTVRVARSEEPLRRELRELLLAMGAGILAAIGAAGLGGYLLAVRTLSPLGRMARQARRITADRLSERIEVPNPDDELGRLALVFNDTFARLERSFESLRRFAADASHELRTPLTALRSVGEVGLQEPKDGERYREIIGSMLEEVDRLTRLVDGLLTLSRADACGASLSGEEMDLAVLAREVAAQLEVLAEEKSQSVAVEAAGPLLVTGDPGALRQAVTNLLDNAIKYTPRGGSVRVRAFAEGRRAVLEVIDSGPGIPAEHQPHVFERFYRIDRARSRELGGAGLGLAIAKLAVEKSGGRLELESREGCGSTFRIVLPERQESSGEGRRLS